MKRTILKRRTPLRARPKRVNRSEPGRVAWKTRAAGYCSCGCDRFSMSLHRHHVVTEQHVRLAGGNPWNQANAMLLHPLCHANHHSAHRRIPLESVPEPAIDFACELLGLERGAMYLARFYDAEVDREGWQP